MDANITLSLRDIYEEFLYNRDIGHEQIMYIIEQQQQESPLPEQDKTRLQKFLSGLDDKKRAILKERKSIPKFRLTASITKSLNPSRFVNDKVGINGMIYRNLDVFKYNSEKLNLREIYNNRDTNESLQQVKGFANDSVECIKDIIKYQKPEEAEAPTSVPTSAPAQAPTSNAEEAASDTVQESVQEKEVQEPVPGPAKKEDLPFLDLIREKELGNTQNENIVAPIDEEERKEQLKETMEKSAHDFIESKEDEDVVVTGGGDAKGGDAIKHLNDEKNNPFLNVSKEMIKKACNLTADSCTIDKVCDVDKIANELESEIDDGKKPALKNFIRRHDKYNSFIKYIYGKYFTSLEDSSKNKIIDNSTRDTTKFATNIVNNICIEKTSGSIAPSLYNSSYGNINLIANFFEQDILSKERGRIKALSKIFKDIKKIRENIENIKKYQAWANSGAKDKNEYIIKGEKLVSDNYNSDANKALQGEESKLTTEVANVKVDTFMNLYAGLNLVCIYGYNIFDEKIKKRPTIIKNLGIMMAMYEIESLDNHVRIARLNGHTKVADSLEKINLASQGDGDKEVRKQVRVTFENHFELLKKSVMAQAKQAQVEEEQKQTEQKQAEKEKLEQTEEDAKQAQKEAQTRANETGDEAENQTLTTEKNLEDEKEAAKVLAEEISKKQGEKMNKITSKDNKESSEEETSGQKKKKENDFFEKSIGINENTDKRGKLIEELIRKLPEQEQEEGQQVVAKNYIKIIKNCLTFNVIPWHVVKYTIDEMLKVKEEKVKEEKVIFSGLFDGIDETNLGNDDNKKTLLDQFFTDAFYWNTYEKEKEKEFVNDFRIKVITSTVTINDVYKSIRKLYIQNIQQVLQSKSGDMNNTFIDKFKESPMNPVYQKVLYDYFYKKYILNVEKGPKYFTDLYTSSSVEGIKIFYEGLENQVIRISQTNNEKFFMHAPGVTKNSNYDDGNLLEEIGNEAKLYFYDEKDKSFILDMMQKINIEEIDEILSKGDNVMGNVYSARKHELRKYLNYFNIFMVAQAGNMKFIGKAYNRLRKQLKSILDKQ